MTEHTTKTVMTTPTTAEQIDAVLAEHGLQTLYMLADDADSARLRSVAATIARLEGELIAEQRAHEEIASACFAAGAQTDDGTSLSAVRSLVSLLTTERTRADAAERRVEAVLSEAAVDAAAKALCRAKVGTPDDIEVKSYHPTYAEWAQVALRAALAAASGDTATTEG